MINNSILVVDDEPAILRSIKSALRLEGYPVHATADPREAIQLVSEEDIAVIICDQRMPHLSGLDILQQMRELRPDTVRILMTGYPDINITIAAINAGQIFRYIAKPWTSSGLVEAVQAAIAYRQAALDKREQLSRMAEKEQCLQALTQELKVLLAQSRENAVNSLKKVIQVKDMELYQHSERVAQYAGRMAELAGLSADRQHSLSLACYFHDIGKIAIKDKVIDKPGKLNDEERELIKLHPQYGADILNELKFLPEIAQIVLQHHEKLDGAGYPYGLRGEEILLEARILAVADAFDAMRTDRPYKLAYTQCQSYELLRKEQGTHFDSHIVDLFISAGAQLINPSDGL